MVIIGYEDTGNIKEGYLSIVQTKYSNPKNFTWPNKEADNVFKLYEN